MNKNISRVVVRGICANNNSLSVEHESRMGQK